MGIDAEIYIKANLTPERREDVEAYLRDRCPSLHDWDGHVISQDSHGYNDGRWNLNILNRWYAPGYERGHWPEIYGMIRAMQAAFPGQDVYYGSDSGNESCDPVTPEFLEGMWQHWLGPNGRNYYNR